MGNTIRFCKVRDVKDPQRAHPTDAGIDFFVPRFTSDADITVYPSAGIRLDWNVDVLRKIVILPGASVLVPLGVKVRVPEGYAMIFFNKSGVAAKKSLVLGSCVVDQDYQGELILNLHNISNDWVEIVPGEKIVQGILLEVNHAVPEAVNTVGELYPEKTDRGEGGFGSTN